MISAKKTIAKNQQSDLAQVEQDPTDIETTASADRQMPRTRKKIADLAAPHAYLKGKKKKGKSKCDDSHFCPCCEFSEILLSGRFFQLFGSFVTRPRGRMRKRP